MKLIGYFKAESQKLFKDAVKDDITEAFKDAFKDDTNSMIYIHARGKCTARQVFRVQCNITYCNALRTSSMTLVNLVKG